MAKDVDELDDIEAKNAMSPFLSEKFENTLKDLLASIFAHHCANSIQSRFIIHKNGENWRHLLMSKIRQRLTLKLESVKKGMWYKNQWDIKMEIYKAQMSELGGNSEEMLQISSCYYQQIDSK